jgi:hypothetical protein
MELCFGRDQYCANAALELVHAALGCAGETWPERQLAVLLLENQLLRLAPDRLNEFDEVSAKLRLEPRESTADLIRRVRRLNRAHQAIRKTDFDPVAWAYFFRTARDVSKLTLARYVFSVEEVVEEIRRHLVVTKGAQAKPPYSLAPVTGLPDYETEILARLSQGSPVYWVSEKCGSELNALVEYPLTSAVVVIKPPGSDVEFEIKRAGTRGPRRLDVVAWRNGKETPVSHRLFGGSLGWLGNREASSAERFCRIYGMVHGTEGPCSRTAWKSSLVTVPNGDAEVHLLDYLTDPAQFGEGFDETRRSMQLCVTAFPGDTGVLRAAYEGEGEAALTLRFIGQALPQQAIIFGSSSFRLDRIALYLSPLGPEHYFGATGRGYRRRDVQWLADSVVEEVLGEMVTPPEPYTEYAKYIDDIFRVPENRSRADAAFLSTLRQLGQCWGTLLGVRGFSDGESFVQRNVGIKSIYKDGAWQVRMIFMDHDDLTMAGSRYRYLWPSREVPGMLRDHVHILGGPLSGDTIPGALEALRNIYRVNAAVDEEGLRGFKESLRAAYRATHDCIDTNAELQQLLYPEFVLRHRDFDILVAFSLESDSPESEPWKEQAAAYLRARDYSEELIAESIESIRQFRGYFERMSFLY